MPAGATYFQSQHRDAGSNTIHWERSLGASETLGSAFTVKVNPGTQESTVSNVANRVDDGGNVTSATAVTTIK
jgi:hypothetical protein